MKYVQAAPDFERACVKWIVLRKKSFQTVEDTLFRDVCLSLTSKAPLMTVRSLKSVIMNETTKTQAVVSKMLGNMYFSLTSDGWTSRSQQSYVAITVHWINSKWELKSCALGCEPKEGSGSAEAHCNEVESIMDRFSLTYKNFVASVTDTESTMVSYGNFVQERSMAHGGHTEWLGCVDHLLELTTGIAFNDTQYSDECMSTCRKLCGFFHKSAKASQSLLELQRTMNVSYPVTIIQDVVTRW